MIAEVRVDAERLRTFTARAFEQVGVAHHAAAIAADVLVAADLRGVESHGVARLHHYLAHLQQGFVACATQVQVVRELPTQPAVARVQLPGEQEHRTAAQRRSEGIPLHADVVASLATIAADFDLEPVA